MSAISRVNRLIGRFSKISNALRTEAGFLEKEEMVNLNKIADLQSKNFEINTTRLQALKVADNIDELLK